MSRHDDLPVAFAQLKQKLDERKAAGKGPDTFTSLATKRAARAKMVTGTNSSANTARKGA